MLRFVREQFPEFQIEILDLYLRDLEFRRVIHDIAVCFEQITRLTKDSAADETTVQKLAQYRELKNELKVEMFECLDSASSKPRNSGGAEKDDAKPERKPL